MTEKSWREIPIGGVVPEPGSSIKRETGAWRTLRPIRDMDKCVHCLLCWIYCPDGAIEVENGMIKDVDLSHCKGCGICAEECPKGAVEMVEEAKVAGK